MHLMGCPHEVDFCKHDIYMSECWTAVGCHGDFSVTVTTSMDPVVAEVYSNHAGNPCPHRVPWQLHHAIPLPNPAVRYQLHSSYEQAKTSKHISQCTFYMSGCELKLSWGTYLGRREIIPAPTEPIKSGTRGIGLF